MSVWFEGTNEIATTIQEVREAVEDLGAHYVGVVGRMPGLTSVELVDQTSDSVTIKTNEGTMSRTNISVHVDDDRVAVELDEEYQSGLKVTTRSHFLDEFTTSDQGVTHRLVISDVDAPGFLGFLYRRFGGSKMGNAFLSACASYFEQRTT